jgi:hypothetical protein
MSQPIVLSVKPALSMMSTVSRLSLVKQNFGALCIYSRGISKSIVDDNHIGRTTEVLTESVRKRLCARRPNYIYLSLLRELFSRLS